MKKFYLTVLMLFLGITVCAQDTLQKKNQIEDSRFVYYLQLSGGINYPLMENIRFFKSSASIRPIAYLSGGMEFNPYWSADVSLGYNRGLGIRNMNTNGEVTYVKYNLNSIDFFAKGAFNLAQYIGGFKHDRKNNVYFNLGLGVSYSYGAKKDREQHQNAISPAVRAGFTYSYQFNKRIAAIADIGVAGFTDSYNGFKTQIPIDARLDAQVGIRVYFGKKGAEKWEREPEIQYVEKIVVERDTILITEYIEKEIIKEVPAKTTTIFFSINSHEIRESEMHKIAEIVAYMDEHPEKTLFVIGTADRNTGNDKINSRLSTERARSVAEILIEEFDIDPARVRNMMGKPDKEDLFREHYEKNRAAICIITDFKE